MSFTKLHGTIIHSSIWGESDHVRITWITMIAMADADGIVQASIGGLARAAQVSREQCIEALEVFLGPDPDSRDGTTGERIEKVPGGWLILNHANYRDRQTRAQELTAARVRRHRAKKRNDVTSGSARNGLSRPEAEAEAEAENPIDSLRSSHVSGADGRAPEKPSKEPEGFSDWWHLYPKKTAKKAASRAWSKLKPSAKLREEIMAATKLFAQSVRQPEFVPNPATWINQGRWEDDLSSSTACQGAPQRGGKAPTSAHIPNTPLGSPSCPCVECVRFRSRKDVS